ncbi:hypothetical protein O6H91_09G039700 [Diphasiastrum complanatum]|nr:hypothetical protein O6H91_09G039700 [Diphasiastrum complanatum]
MIFVLDEFDLFAQRSKQSLLYNLLDLMQSSSSQAALIGVSSRLDADQLLEKRVRSRFSHCKLLFLPPSTDDIFSLYDRLFLLPVNQCSHWQKFSEDFKEKASVVLQQGSVKQLVDEFMSMEVSGQRCVDLLFRALCELNPQSGHISPAQFKVASANLTPQPKLEILTDVSVLELCLLVAMYRLEAREVESYNFNTVFKEYKRLEEHNTCDVYSKQCALRAFEHLLERELIVFKDSSGLGNMLEVRPIKLLVSRHEIDKGLEGNISCPTILRQWRTHETIK